MKRFQGMVFDFNGTLFFDAVKHEKAWDQMASDLRGRPFSDAERDGYIHGRTNADIFAYLLARKVEGEELKGLIERKETLYQRFCIEEEGGSLSRAWSREAFRRLKRERDSARDCDVERDTQSSYIQRVV